MNVILRKLHIPASMVLLKFLLIFLLACGGGEDEPGGSDPVIPSELKLEIWVLGTDGTNPNGDGSGMIKCTATANDAVRFGFKFGTDPEVPSTTGIVDHTYATVGTNTYPVTVYAYSGTGNSVNITKSVTVYVKQPELKLIWSDEFSTDGPVSAVNWIHETVPPDNGNWYNGEKQHYTDRTDNSYVSDGTLKIVAKRETYTAYGTQKLYTSARLNSKFNFTYGRLEVRAKLPKGSGTWPAIWMLGSNISTVGWPACGEIDVMEHWGHIPGEVSSATHTPSCSGGCANVRVGATQLNDYDIEFHVYSLEWTKESLRFLIDGVFKYAYKPAVKNDNTWPFTADQFIILNVAMGGSWFTIDPNFTESAMEIDYVRIYQ